MVASPIEHQSKFEDLSSEGLSEFARLVYHLLQALELRLPNHAYNFVSTPARFTNIGIMDFIGGSRYFLDSRN